MCVCGAPHGTHLNVSLVVCVRKVTVWPPIACVLSVSEPKTFSIVSSLGRGSWTLPFSIRLLVASLTRLSAPSFCSLGSISILARQQSG